MARTVTGLNLFLGWVADSMPGRYVCAVRPATDGWVSEDTRREFALSGHEPITSSGTSRTHRALRFTGAHVRSARSAHRRRRTHGVKTQKGWSSCLSVRPSAARGSVPLVTRTSGALSSRSGSGSPMTALGGTGSSWCSPPRPRCRRCGTARGVASRDCRCRPIDRRRRRASRRVRTVTCCSSVVRSMSCRRCWTSDWNCSVPDGSAAQRTWLSRRTSRRAPEPHSLVSELAAPGPSGPGALVALPLLVGSGLVLDDLALDDAVARCRGVLPVVGGSARRLTPGRLGARTETRPRRAPRHGMLHRRKEQEYPGNVGDQTGQGEQHATEDTCPAVPRALFWVSSAGRRCPKRRPGPAALALQDRDTDHGGREIAEDRPAEAHPLADEDEHDDLDDGEDSWEVGGPTGAVRTHRRPPRMRSRSIRVRSRRPHAVMRASASRTIAPVIFESPFSRSTNVIGVSTTHRPARTARRARST